MLSKHRVLAGEKGRIKCDWGTLSLGRLHKLETVCSPVEYDTTRS